MCFSVFQTEFYNNENDIYGGNKYVSRSRRSGNDDYVCKTLVWLLSRDRLLPARYRLTFCNKFLHKP